MQPTQGPYAGLDADHTKIEEQRRQQELEEQKLREEQRAKYEATRDAELRQRLEEEQTLREAAKQKTYDEVQREREQRWKDEHGPDAERSADFKAEERRTLEKGLDEQHERQELNDQWKRESQKEQERTARKVFLTRRSGERAQAQDRQRGIDD